MADPPLHDTVAEPGELIGSTQLGRYRVTRKIGQGGMGAVYEAVHVKLDKRVAIKVLLEKYANSEGVVQRLEQEARLASAIGDPHIIDVADIGQTDDGRTLIVMELLAGESLAHLIARTDMTETRIASLVSQAARALAAAHGKGVIHRDIKPENLFVLTRDGGDFVKVVDFGISKLVRGDREDPRLTGTGMVIGTAAYMSPEQARGDDVDERTDVYALGVVMFEAATGRLPFQAENYLKMLSEVANAEAPSPRSLRPSLSERFERIAMKAMAKNRDHRYASARELADALDALAAGTATAPTAAMPHTPAPTAPARPPISTVPTASAPVRRRTWLAIAGGAAVAAAIALALVVTLRGGGGDTVEIAIESDPPGAAILEGDKVLGYAPMTYRFLRENKIVELTAQMVGYDIACFKVNPAEEAHLVHVRMPDAGTTDCLHKR
jgi:eukaryotic-like serine/threonine-protein kinase